MWGWKGLEVIGLDLKLAVRRLKRSPGFASLIVGTLALGIGANTAIFSVVNAVLLRPVAAPEPDRIVVFGTSRQGLPPAGGSPARFNAWRQLHDLFLDVSAYRIAAMNLGDRNSAEQARVAQVSADYFRLFGLAVFQGRIFTDKEDLPQAGSFAVVSDSFWRRTLSSDAEAIGATIRLDDTAYEVVGIARSPDETDPESQVDVWIPFQINPASTDQSHFFSVAGRIKPGITLAQIEAGLQAASEAFSRKYPDMENSLGGSQFVVRPIRDVAAGNVGPALLALQGLVAVVLLIACVNVVNLLLARGVVRRREMAIRAGLGAGRARLVRQLFTEGALLWAAGGLAGLVLGVSAIRFLLAINAAGLPRIGLDGSAVTVDWRVLCFTLLVSVATAIVFGFLPALSVSRADLSAVINANGSADFGKRGIRSLLVVGQIALALTLVVGAGLLMKTFIAMQSVDSGLDPSDVLTMQVRLRDETTAGLAERVRDSLTRIRAIPGVEAAAAACCLPSEAVPNGSFSIVGREPGVTRPRANMPSVSPGYFAAATIPLIQGRTFSEEDRAGGRRVAVISNNLARRLWPDGQPIGAHLALGYEDDAAEPFEIVGIVGDVRSRDQDEAAATVYLPLEQVSDAATAYYVQRPTAWIIRSAAAPESIANAVKRELQESSGRPVIAIRSMDEVLAGPTARAEFNLTLMLAFGSLALLLAATGIYGLLTFHVQQRRAEIGIRMALGATRGEVRKQVILQGMRFAAIGIVTGLIAALSFADLLSIFLFGVEPRDPGVFTTAALLLGAAALIAAAIPAFRAGGLDPVAALRQD